MHKSNDKGFSLVELIVVIAIMAVLLGVLTLSLSLLMGTEAKQACSKMDGQLNEVKTSAMSRYDETLKLKYFTKAETDAETGANDGIDKAGYYVIKEMTTLHKPDGSEAATDITRVIGSESRRIGSNRAMITVNHGGVSSVVKTESLTGVSEVVITYDRATGAIKSVTLDGVDGGELQSIDFEAGTRKYTIAFETLTGKHWIE